MIKRMIETLVYTTVSVFKDDKHIITAELVCTDLGFTFIGVAYPPAFSIEQVRMLIVDDAGSHIFLM